MKWTKAHSRNAVAAKARLRIARALAAGEPPAATPTSKLPKLVPDFTINIRTRTGERVQITATRWNRQFITGDGIKSARQISRGIELLLRHFTLNQ